MTKQAISVTLSSDNILWLRGRAVSLRARSISDVLDRIIQEARSARAIRSVVGTVTLAESDPDLSRADAAIRRMFAKSLSRDEHPETGSGQRSTGFKKRRRG